MSFGHRGFSQLHNLRKRRKDGVTLGGAQGIRRGAFCGWGSPSHHIISKRSASSIGELERKGGLVSFTLGGMDCVLGMEFIAHNNVLIEGHNILVSDTLPSSFLDPLEGPSMLNCGKLELKGPHPTSSTKGGKRGVLEVSGFD
jgi:hypothetical protein